MGFCKKCGTWIDSRKFYCKECEKTGVTKKCECCGMEFTQQITDTVAIYCPECREKAKNHRCSYCGKWSKKRDDIEFICPKCNHKQIEKKESIWEIQQRARAMGLSYGMYVAMKESGMRLSR